MLQLVVEKAEIEASVMCNQRTVAQKFKQLVRLFPEGWLVGQKPVGQAMDLLGSRGHGALRIEICVEVLARHDSADHFDAAYFDHTVPGCGVEASRFGIKYNFTHSGIRCEPVCGLMQVLPEAF